MELTRRGLIGRAAAAGGALASAGLFGRADVAFAGPDGEAVFEARIPHRGAASGAAAASGASWRSGPIRAPRRFELLGIEIAHGSDPGLEVRARLRDGRWSGWLAAPLAQGHAPDADRAGEPGGRRLSEPVWTGPASFYELRAQRPLPGARVVFVDGGRTPATAAASRFVDSGLDAGPGQPHIISRAAWATRACRPREAPEYGNVELAIVHHTVNANHYSRGQAAGMVRSICLFHKYGNRWNDIGYNFVVDRYGQIFEGRAGGIDEPLVGAHAGGYNVYSSGVALLGTHSGVGPARAAFDALARLIGWKLALHGIAPRGRASVVVTRPDAPVTRYRPGTRVALNRISGHGDGNTTSCPGAAMRRQLPRLRQVAERLAGTPSTLTLAFVRSAPGGALVSGALQRDGSPIAGATVEVQRRARSDWVPAGGATTQPDGTWSAGFALTRNAVLRAVYRGGNDHPPVVSPRIDVAVPPLITLSASQSKVPPGQVVLFSGTTSPPSRRVLTLWLLQHKPDGVNFVARRIQFRAGEDGSFSRSVGFPEPGRYDVVVSSDADSVNDAGSSSAVAITVG